MTLNTKIRVFVDFWRFQAARHIEERTAPKSIEIDMDKLHTKFSVLNEDFDRPSLDSLG